MVNAGCSLRPTTLPRVPPLPILPPLPTHHSPLTTHLHPPSPHHPPHSELLNNFIFLRSSPSSSSSSSSTLTVRFVHRFILIVPRHCLHQPALRRPRHASASHGHLTESFKIFLTPGTAASKLPRPPTHALLYTFANNLFGDSRKHRSEDNIYPSSSTEPASKDGYLFG